MPSYTARELERETGFGRRTIAYYVQEGLLPKVGRRGPRTRYPELVLDRLLFIRRVREAEEAGEIGPVPLSHLREVFRQSSRRLIAGVARDRIPVSAELVSPSSIELRSMADWSTAATEPDPESEGRFMGVRESRGPLSWSPREGRVSEDLPTPHISARHAKASRARLESMEAESMEFEGKPAPLDAVEAQGKPERLAAEAAEVQAMRERLAAEAGELRAMREPPASRRLSPARAPATPGLALAEVFEMLQFASRRRRELSPDSVDTWSQIDITPDIRFSVRGLAEEDAPLLKRIGRLLRQLSAGSPRKYGE